MKQKNLCYGNRGHVAYGSAFCFGNQTINGGEDCDIEQIRELLREELDEETNAI